MIKSILLSRTYLLVLLFLLLYIPELQAQQPSRSTLPAPAGEALSPYTRALHTNTFDGGMITVFQTTTSNLPATYILKTTAGGITQWSSRIDAWGSFDEIVQTADSGFTFCYTQSSSYYVIHFDVNGNTVYSRRIYTPAPYTVQGRTPHVLAKPNGNCYIIGDLFDTTQLNDMYHVFELDAAGNTLWSHTYHQGFGKASHKDAALCDNGDLVVLTENFDIPNSHHSPLVTRIAPGGNVVWSNYYTQPSFTGVVPRALVVMPGDEIVVASGFGNLTLLLRLDGQGNVMWHNAYSRPSNYLLPEDVMAAENNSNVLLGTSNSASVIVKIDSLGNVPCAREYANITLHRGHTLNSQLYTATGVKDDLTAVVLLFTNVCGNACEDPIAGIVVTPVSTVVTPRISSLALSPTNIANTPSISTVSLTFQLECDLIGIQESELTETHVYPVPAQDQIRFESSLEVQTAELLDVNGKIVFTENIRGSYSATLSLPELADGVYLLRLSGNKGVIAQRKVVIQQEP